MKRRQPPAFSFLEPNQQHRRGARAAAGHLAGMTDNPPMQAAHRFPATQVLVDARAVRLLRIGSGLILAAYVSAHLLNHALGVFSVDTQEALLDE
jgi:hypothetical protein